jgi:hypothetical protein
MGGIEDTCEDVGRSLDIVPGFMNALLDDVMIAE